MQGWLNPAVFPPLDVIGAALWKGLASGALLDDIAISLQRAGTAFGAAVAIGVLASLICNACSKASCNRPPARIAMWPSGVKAN